MQEASIVVEKELIRCKSYKPKAGHLSQSDH